MSDSLSREQLLDYIKKQKLKIKKLEAKSTELSSELESFKTAKQVESTPSEANNTDELEDCFEKISSLEEELEAKSKELKTLQNSTKNRIKLLENEVNSKNEEVALLQTKVSDDGDALVEHLRIVQLLKDAFNEKDSALAAEAEKSTALQSQLLTVQESLAAAKTSAIDLPSPLEDTPCSQCVEYEESVKKLEQTVSKCKNMVKVKMKEIDSQKQQISASDARVEGLLSEISDLASKAETRDKEESQHLVTIADLQSQLQLTETKVDTFRTHVEEAISRERLNQENQSKEKKLLYDKIEGLNKQILIFETEKVSCAVKTQDLQDSLGAQQAEAANSSAHILQLEAQLSALHARESDFNVASEDIIVKLNESVQREKDLTSEKDALLTKQNSDGVVMSDLREELSSLHGKMKEADHRAAVAAATNEDADTELKDLQQQLSNLKDLSTAKEAEASGMSDTIQSLEAELNNAHSELTGLQPLKVEMVSLKEEIDLLKSQLQHHSSSTASSNQDSVAKSTAASPPSNQTSVTTSGSGGSNNKKNRKRNKNKSNNSVGSAAAEGDSVKGVDTVKDDDCSGNKSGLSEKINQLKATISMLMQEKESLQDTVQQSMALAQNVEELHHQVDNLTAKLDLAGKDLLEQKGLFEETLNNERVSLEQIISSKETLLQELQRDFDEASKSIEQMRADEADKNISVQEQQQRADEVEELRVLLGESELKLSESAKCKDALKKEVEQSVQLRTDCSRLQTQLEEISDRLHLSEKENMASIANLSQQLEEALSNSETSEFKKAELEKQLNEHSDVIDVLRSSLQAKETEVKDLILQMEEVSKVQDIAAMSDLEGKLSDATDTLSRVEADNAQLQSSLDAMHATAQANEEAATAKNAAHEQQLDDLSSQLTALTGAAAADQAPAECFECRNLTEEVEAKRQELVKAETTVTKYKHMVKSKMKEINDLTDATKQAKVKITTLTTDNSVLEQQVSELDSSIRRVEEGARDQRAKHVQELTDLKESVSLFEKELATSTATILRTTADLEDCKKQCIDYEISVQKLKQDVEEREQDIQLCKDMSLNATQQGTSENERKIQDLIRGNSESTAQLELIISELREELEGEKKEVQNLKEAMKVVNENFSAKFDKERSDTVAEQQALNSKIKRLKTLLTKSGSINKEKDAEIALLKKKEAVHLEDKWTSFSVLLRVEDTQNSSGLPRYATTQGQACDIWCLIVNESASVKSEETSSRNCQSKWILESQMSNYMQVNELTLVGSVPDNTLQQDHSVQVKEIEDGHLMDVNNLRTEIDTVTQNFQAYKVSIFLLHIIVLIRVVY
jgi:chromosome segregation ATPase